MNSIARNSLLTGTASLALAPGIGALATSPADAAPPPPPMVQSWAGFYVGVNIGAADEFSSFNDPNGTFAYVPGVRTGWALIGGGQIGYNWQHGTFVYGLEADISGLTKPSGTHFTNPLANPVGCCTYGSHVPWLATIRGRLGFTVNPATLVYATAGVAIGQVKASTDETFYGESVLNYSSTRVGWVVGGGIEQMISSHWTIGVEGLFVDLGAYTKSANGKCCATVHNSMAIARVKANYRF